MYKITNIKDDERGFETDGKMFVLKPKESVIVKKKPEVPEEIFKIEAGQEEKAKKPIEEKQQKPEVKK